MDFSALESVLERFDGFACRRSVATGGAGLPFELKDGAWVGALGFGVTTRGVAGGTGVGFANGAGGKGGGAAEGGGGATGSSPAGSPGGAICGELDGSAFCFAFLSAFGLEGAGLTGFAAGGGGGAGVGASPPVFDPIPADTLTDHNTVSTKAKIRWLYTVHHQRRRSDCATSTSMRRPRNRGYKTH
ncbi:MAG TPA: hypothetical protein DCQ06_02830 [Myxococcales bacterium]|nr:hypothetical protein [Myxococcales bacterium]HAN30509.1 hypothetical protein [Myxococcales bacterium]